MDYNPPGSFVHGIFQARILERIAMPSSRESSQPRHGTHISCIGKQILYHCSTWEACLRYGRLQIVWQAQVRSQSSKEPTVLKVFLRLD